MQSDKTGQAGDWLRAYNIDLRFYADRVEATVLDHLTGGVTEHVRHSQYDDDNLRIRTDELLMDIRGSI